MGRFIFIFIVVIIGLIFGVQIFWHLLGWATIVAWFVTAVVFVVGMLYALYMMWRAGLFGGGGGGARTPRGKPTFKVWNAKSPNVYIFREEPSLKNVAMLTDELHLTQLELAGDVFSVDNDTQVIVLEDTGGEAVKVKVKGAKKKDRDGIGWVCRSSLIRQEKLIN